MAKKMTSDEMDNVLGYVYRLGGDSSVPIAIAQHVEALQDEARAARATALDAVLKRLDEMREAANRHGLAHSLGLSAAMEAVQAMRAEPGPRE